MKTILKLLLCCLFISSANAENTNPFEADFRSISNSNNFVPEKIINKLKTKKRRVNIKLRSFVPGLGPVVLRLNKEKLRKTIPTITSSKGVLEDKSGITLLRGTVKTNFHTAPTAASIYYTDNTPHLRVAFEGRNPRYKKTKFYRLTIPLTNQKSSIARLKRFRELSEEKNCAEPLKHEHKTTVATLSTSNATSPFQVISLNIEAEKSMFNTHGANTNNVITSYINESETIYQNDLDITYEVIRQNVNTTMNFGNSDSENKLIDYQNYTNSQSFNKGDASMLFTGTDLDGATIGIAYVGAICVSPINSYGLTQFTNAAATPITFAHELGHLLNAEHTFSGIMAATLSSTPATNFSSVSRNEINSFTNSVGCLSNTDNGDSTPTENSGINSIDIGIATSIDRSSGIFTFIYAAPSIENPAECTLDLYSSLRRKKVNNARGTKLISSPMSNVPTTIQVPIERKSRKRNREGNTIRVHFKAFVNCNDGTSGESNTTRVRPFSINISGNLRGGRWITRLRDSL